MLKTNSKEVKDKIKAFILKEATPGADDNGEKVPDYLRRIYTAAVERVKGTKETPAENIVNSCTCFFYGDFVKYYDVKKIMPAAYNSYLQIASPDPAELRAFVKTNKKENPICKLYTPGGSGLYINAIWLSLAIDCFTDPVIEMQEGYTDYKSPVYIRGKEGRLLILPVNINVNGLQGKYKYIFDSANNSEIEAA